MDLLTDKAIDVSETVALWLISVIDLKELNLSG